MSTSNISTLSSNSRYSAQTKFSRSSSLTSFRIPSKASSKVCLGKIDEDSRNDFDPKVLEEETKNSFAPGNYLFQLQIPSLAKEEEARTTSVLDDKKASWTLSRDTTEEAPLEDEVSSKMDKQVKDSIKTNKMDETEVNEDKMKNVTCNDKSSSNEVDEMMHEDVDEVAKDEEDQESKLKVKPFRDLLLSETERMTKTCNDWETKISSNIPDDPSYEDIKGEVRSVVGQGRLIMAERFTQFSGLVDNCEFKRGEKETTVEDLQGFWEMIYIQVEDVDRKFTNISKVEANQWKPLQPQPSIKVSRPRKQAKSKSTSGDVDTSNTKPKQASQGLKALIAARRKAAKSSSEGSLIEVPNQVHNPTKDDADLLTPVSSADPEADVAKTFDGGFFTVRSPMSERRSPRSCKSSSNKLRQVACSNSAKKVNSFLLSPFISAMSKISLRSSG